jgi:molybdopterin converting factor subunit 1
MPANVYIGALDDVVKGRQLGEIDDSPSDPPSPMKDFPRRKEKTSAWPRRWQTELTVRTWSLDRTRPVHYSRMAEDFVTIKVLFFASAREAAGDVSSANFELPAGRADTGTLRRKLAETYPELSSMVMDEDNMTLALNEEYVTSGQVLALKSGDTVALIPPISGG